MKNTNSLLRKLQNKNPKSQKILLAGSMSALLAACDFENFAGFGGGTSGANGNGNNVLTTGDGVSVNLGPNSGTISGGNGADMIRAAANVTISRGGAGKDIFVVLAKTSSAGYTETDLTNVNGSGVDLSDFITLSSINNNANADVNKGKVIDGQADGAVLFVFGDTDFTNVGLFNITQLEINADVTIEAEMLSAMITGTGLVEIGGDNSARLNITNEDVAIVINLTGVSLHDINHLTVPQGVTLIVDQADLADIKFIDGGGTLKAAFWELDLAGIQVGAGITVTDAFDSDPDIVQTFTLDENQVDTGSFHFMGQNGVTYSLAGTDASQFNVNSATGLISFKTAADAENATDANGDNIYDLKIVASAQGYNSLSRDVRITVTNVNEGGPVFGGGATTLTIDENTSAVGNYNATDADLDDVVTYSLAGADAARFNISSSGVVTFKTAPNAELPNDSGGDNVYNVDIVATDTGGLNTTRSVAITVDNVNEFTPIFNANNTVSVSVAENQTAVTTVAATDGDINETITYTLTGADAADFSISNTGVITFNNAPDAETPADAGGDNIFNFTVVATDSGNLSSNRDVIVNVTDIDEFTPTFNDPAAVVTSIDENQTAVTNVGATDPDFGGVITYSVTGADAGFFAVSSTGDLTFRNAPDAENGHGTVGGSNVYNINIVATDLSGKDVTKAATVTVNNVNEATPVFIVAPATIAVNENQSAVTTVSATDADLGSAVTYSMAATGDSTLFSVDANSGVVTFISAPDHENSGDANNDNVYNITIIASDGANNTSHNMAVTVNGLNEFNPVFAGGLPTAINVPENSSGIIQTFGATDGDHEDNITYTLTGDDAGDFSINATTGAVSFAGNPDHENAQDADSDNIYEINIIATDTFSNAQSHSVAITVTAVNESAPAFSSPSTISVDENQTAVGTFAAVDPDTIDNVTYSLVSGGDNDLFTIDPNTGVVVFANAPDREAPTDANTNNIYDIQIVATDTVNSATHNLAVTVNDVNDNAPVFANTDPLRVGVAEGGTVGATVVATDVDAIDTVTYGALGGADAALFSIDGSGVVTFNNVRNMSDNSASGNDIYEITVNVTSGGDNVQRNVSIGVGNAINGTNASDPQINDPLLAASATQIDIVDGGLGLDTYVLDGTRNDYTFTLSDNDLIVTRNANNTVDVDWLRSVENLSFTNDASPITVRSLHTEFANFTDTQFDTWLVDNNGHELI